MHTWTAQFVSFNPCAAVRQLFRGFKAKLACDAPRSIWANHSPARLRLNVPDRSTIIIPNN